MTQVNRTCREHGARLQQGDLPRIVRKRELTDAQNPLPHHIAGQVDLEGSGVLIPLDLPAGF